MGTLGSAPNRWRSLAAARGDRGQGVLPVPAPRRPDRPDRRAAPGPRGRRQDRSLLSRVRAWMIVIPLDLVMLLMPLFWATTHAKAVVAMAVLSLVLLHAGGRYSARLHLSVLDDLPFLLSKLFVATAVVATAIAMRHEQEEVIRFLNDTILVLVLVLVGRALTTQLILWGRRRGIIQHRVVMIGGATVAADLCRVLQQDRRYGLNVVGFVDDGLDCPAADFVPRLGALGDLDDAVLRTGGTVLLIADGDVSEAALLDAVRSPACLPCDVLVLPRLHHFQTQTGLPDHIGSIPIMRIRTPPQRGPSLAVKRGFDLLVAGFAMVLVAPLLALCALAVRLETGPGVIFRQPRVGYNGKIFDCLKFCTMRPADAAEADTAWSIADDERVGPIGRLLRRTSLDELPQLWNILRGDMTLVGPRPERPYYVSRFSEEFDRYRHRHRVQAGLTGLAQVNGLRGDTSIADRARFDNYYIENWSLWLDVKILLRTLAELIFARGR